MKTLLITLPLPLQLLGGRSAGIIPGDTAGAGD